jgi:hypothetical protein
MLFSVCALIILLLYLFAVKSITNSENPLRNTLIFSLLSLGRFSSGCKDLPIHICLSHWQLSVGVFVFKIAVLRSL